MLNDPRELRGAEFDQMPVLVSFDVVGRTSFLCVVGKATQVHSTSVDADVMRFMYVVRGTRLALPSPACMLPYR